jgi:hypothetical protein
MYCPAAVKCFDQNSYIFVSALFGKALQSLISATIVFVVASWLQLVDRRLEDWGR